MLKPFRALRPAAELAPVIACLPYDVVTTEEARAYAEGNEHCFFHVSRPEIDLPAGYDEHSNEVHEAGRDNLSKFRTRGWLKRDTQARFYLYRQSTDTHAQTGIVGVASIADYDQGLIRKHELTRPDKEDDRTKHIRALGANDEPVFLTYRAEPAIDALVAEVTGSAPEYDFVAEDGVRHTVWVVPGGTSAPMTAALGRIPGLYIADGHHRCAAASRAHQLYRELGQSTGGHDRFLATIFPHDQVQILDYNRVVKDLGGRSTPEFLRALEQNFSVVSTQQKKPAQPRQFGLYADGQWYHLDARPGTYPDTPLGALDVSILQENVLRALLDIADVRADPRVQFVGGVRGVQTLEQLVDNGRFRAAFTLFPTSLEQLMAVADAGEVMPPKSTWFEPKLRSGLFVHLFF